MSKKNVGQLKGIASTVARLPKRVVTDVYLDLRDFTRWSRDRIPHWTGVVTEKWLGFWYTFLLVHVLGLVGIGAIWTAQWASSVPLLTSTVSWLVLLIATIGIYSLFLYGLALAGIIIASVFRVLFWLRRVSKRYWRNHTPPYDEIDDETNTDHQPTAENGSQKVWTNARGTAEKGALAFMIFMPSLLWLELNYPTQLYAVLENPALTSVASFMNASVWIIDFGALLGPVGLGTVQVVGLVIMFGLPGFFFTLSAYNMLYWTEKVGRKQIDEAAEEGVLGRKQLWVATQFLLFTLWGSGIVYEIISAV